MQEAAGWMNRVLQSTVSVAENPLQAVSDVSGRKEDAEFRTLQVAVQRPRAAAQQTATSCGFWANQTSFLLPRQFY